MNKTISLLIMSVLLLTSALPAQEVSTVSKSRKKNIKNQLDYRYRGGFYSFEKLFNKNVTYPEVLQKNCIMGIVIVSFVVNCDGELTDFSIKNPIHPLINEQLAKFFDLTQGQWNTCEDEKYSRFEIPIQFRINDVETNMQDAVFVCVTDTPGYVCNDDSYYFKKAEKLLEKGNGKKAEKYLDILIKRDPYNIEYYEMKKEAISLFKK
ncbi:MAG: hypothetical protein DRI88_06555 [Bacteroidetes bacterium]|nr:MAG: hypothetical protein DRI72_02090 [Bacteroidota bacterium]RLD47142.1 MAG: hypothetical protein DRI88_06555 [Bacteroidota bacterium]RLD74528.1 MAG: hypothetical protein DRI87_00745 [Bacteroidota bacterium]RLD86852.1 MAG: hypothetical protein DRJ02_07835 [Bacteroidota bacterium]HHL57838.1 hypothetical protein [Bacteroidota bacterium]